MRRGRVIILVGLLYAATRVFPLQQIALTVFRFPYAVVKTAVSSALLLPRLPALTNENAVLRAELSQIQLELASAREAVHQSARVAALTSAVASKGLVASVIGRSTIPTQQLVLLNRGARDGVTLDHVVVDASGVVGRVTEVTRSTAMVTLVTDPDSRIAALVERSREAGLLVGRGRSVCDLIYLDIDADIQAGDRVMTAGLSGSFPKGLRLGEVTSVQRDAVAGTTIARVHPSARIGQLEDVLCVAP